MYEIEKKFILTNAQKEKLIKNAEFLGEVVFTDIYYDTKEYALTKNDIWLRSRDGQFELKLPLHQNGKNLPNQYNEIEGEEKIREIFGIVPRKSFLEDIADFGYAPFCKIKNTKKESFSIERKKILSYLHQKKPRHYRALVEAGVVIE
jgi:adenylate cyclase class IV